MNGLAMPSPFANWLTRIMELRIDVMLPPDELEAELDTLQARLRQTGGALHRLPKIDIDMPGFLFRYREADGEHYIYVEDSANACLAGYTVFNRLIEVNRRIDPHLRAPHSKYRRAYQRRGIAAAIYRWWLNSGQCLISGARQSHGANALWQVLSKEYNLIFVSLQNKSLRYLGTELEKQCKEDLATRAILIGRGWDAGKLSTVTRMSRFPEEGEARRSDDSGCQAVAAHAAAKQFSLRRRG